MFPHIQTKTGFRNRETKSASSFSLFATHLTRINLGTDHHTYLTISYHKNMPHTIKELGQSPTPEIVQLEPIPITLPDDELPNNGPSRLYRALSSSLPVLGSIQKYSSITFTVFSFIHGTSVLIPPSISISLTDELLSMGRSIYQAPYLEEILVFGSLTAHVCSGLISRLIRGWTYRQRHDEGKRNRRARQRMANTVDSTALVKDFEGNIEVRDDNSIGLTGGVSGYIGTGPKKSFIYRMLGLSPLQFSGYLSIPPILFHVGQMRLAPLWIEGDSSYVNMDYVGYLFSQGLWRPVLNWCVYPLLILLTTYHTVYGMLTWLRVKDLQLRKLAMNFISLVSLWGMWSLYCVSKMESSLPGFMTKRFDQYLDAFYLWKW